MKKSKFFIVLCIYLFIVIMFTGCISVKMDVKKNGSCETTYTIDLSQVGGMVSKNDVKDTIEDSIEGINNSAGKKIAKLKSFKEDKKKETITAVISISDINKMNDGSFFGTVKEYKKNDGRGLNNLMDKKEKDIDEDKVSNKLHVVYFPLTGTNEFGLIETTVKVPGTIKYLTNGAELEKKNTALFDGEQVLVVFKKGGGFPLWLLLIIIGVILYSVLKKKKTSPSVNFVASTPASFTTPSQDNPQESTSVQNTYENNQSEL